MGRGCWVREHGPALALAGIVLETAATSEHGGSGIANDWDAVARYQATGDLSSIAPLIAAGGLTPENVGEVVRRIRPWAVDVSSGVESEVGKGCTFFFAVPLRTKEMAHE